MHTDVDSSLSSSALIKTFSRVGEDKSCLMPAYFTFDDTSPLVSLVSFLAVAFVCIFPHILRH